MDTTKLMLLFLATACGGQAELTAEDFDHGTPGEPGVSAHISPDPDYPAAPFGYGVGSTIADLEFLGWREPAVQQYDVERLAPVRLSDYYDPDSKGDVRVLWLTTIVAWCPTCTAMFKALRVDGALQQLHDCGFEVLGVMSQGYSALAEPATPLELKSWGEAYEVTSPLLLDPGAKLTAYASEDHYPFNLFVDTATMRILAKSVGAVPLQDASTGCPDLTALE